jgi:hypothetical protein
VIVAGVDLAKVELEEFLEVLATRHPELRRPVALPDFHRMAERERIIVQYRDRMRRPARLLRLSDVALYIQISRLTPPRSWATFGMHELCHFWRDDPGMPCYNANPTWQGSPSEDFAETFAWWVTQNPRIAPPYLPPGAFLSGDLTFPVKCVGTSYRARSLEQICGAGKWDGNNLMVTAVLVLEDVNPYDPNAVRIDIEEKPVGYLSRADAVRYREMLVRRGLPKRRHHCWARITGGWERGGNDRGHYGVRLDLQLPNHDHA